MGEGEKPVFTDLGQFLLLVKSCDCAELGAGLGPAREGLELWPSPDFGTACCLLIKVVGKGGFDRIESRRDLDPLAGRVVSRFSYMRTLVDCVSGWSVSSEGGSPSLVGLRAGKDWQGHRLTSQKVTPHPQVSFETLVWDISVLVRWEKLASLSSSKPNLGLGSPINHLGGKWSTLNSRPHQDLLKLGFKKRASDDFSHFLRFQRRPAVRLPN